MAQPPLLIQEGNSESRFVCMNARTTQCQNWRRHADTIAHKSEKMANLQAAVYDRRGLAICAGLGAGTPLLETRPETPVFGRKAMGARKLVYGDATLASKPNRP